MEEDLKEKLSTRPCSLIIDNATFCGSNLYALRVRYLDKEWVEDLKDDVTIIKNKIVTLSNLEDSSSGQTLKEIVEEKLFSNEQIKKKNYRNVT